MESFPGEWIEDREEFFTRYTESGNGKNVLKDVLRVQMSLERNSAVLSNGEVCDITIQEASDNFFDKVDYQWKLGEPPTQPIKQDDTSEYFFQKLEESGKKYCNSNLYLACRAEDVTTSPPAYKCLCPSDMIWQRKKCVVKKGGRCSTDRDKNDDGNYFVKFDVVGETFGQGDRYLDCEKKTRCRTSNEICKTDRDIKVFVPPKELAVFFKKTIDAGIDFDHLDYKLCM